MTYISELTGLALQVPALEVAVEFYTRIWGLRVLERQQGVVRLRGASSHVSLLSLREGPAVQLDHLVFAAHDRAAVDRLAENLQRQGHRLLGEPGASFPEGDYGLACVDADGRECRVVAVPRDEAAIDDPLMPINLSHIVLNTPQGEANRAFYFDAMGFEYTPSTSRFPMHFLRCDRAHHRIALWTGAPRAFLNHVAFEMRDIDSFLRRSGWLIKQGCKLIAGPGRHTTGENAYSYFLDPNNLVIEITTDMEQITQPVGYIPKSYPPGGDQWGFGIPLDSPEMRQYTV